MASWGHTLVRKSVFLTCLYSWRVYDGSAACRGRYTVVPEVGFYFVKMRNKWLPGAAGEKLHFLKKYYQECHSGSWLTEGLFFFVQIECFYSEIHGNCLLNAHCSGHMGEEHPSQHLDVFCLKEVLTGAAPPFPKVWFCLPPVQNVINGGLFYCVPFKNCLSYQWKLQNFLVDELDGWMDMNLVGKGNLKMSLHSTLCRTENMSVNPNKENSGGRGPWRSWNGRGSAKASPHAWKHPWLSGRSEHTDRESKAILKKYREHKSVGYKMAPLNCLSDKGRFCCRRILT